MGCKYLLTLTQQDVFFFLSLFRFYLILTFGEFDVEFSQFEKSLEYLWCNPRNVLGGGVVFVDLVNDGDFVHCVARRRQFT